MNEITHTRKPPVATTGILGWLRMNLFSNWVNSLISIFKNESKFEFWSIKFTPSKKLFEKIY